jgi:hypothetical protein
LERHVVEHLEPAPDVSARAFLGPLPLRPHF